MSVTAQTIKAKKRVKPNVKRVGRGNASGKGTYAARGLKGQRSRSGGKGGLKLKGFKAGLQKVPKLRGFKSIAKKPEAVNLSDLERVFKVGEMVTPFVLREKGLIRTPKNGAKIIATGELKKKLQFEGCTATKKAVEIIEKAGGSLKF